jgi:hypothetical protein
MTDIDSAAVRAWAAAEAEKDAQERAEQEQGFTDALARVKEAERERLAAENERLLRLRAERRRSTVAESAGTQDLIREVCDEIRDFLVEKNAQYGDSAIDPVRIFSKADPAEQLLVRIDDKLSRIGRGDDRLESDEDVLTDLVGYLVLYRVAQRKAARADA